MFNHPRPGTEQAGIYSTVESLHILSQLNALERVKMKIEREREGEKGKKRAVQAVLLTTPVIIIHKHIPLSECEVGDQLSHRRGDPLRPLLARASNGTKVIVVFKGKYFFIHSDL